MPRPSRKPSASRSSVRWLKRSLVGDVASEGVLASATACRPRRVTRRSGYDLAQVYDHTASLLRRPSLEPVTPRRTPARGRAFRPFTGVRVLSFEVAYSLPAATRLLAELGAEVVKVAPPRGVGFADFTTAVDGVSLGKPNIAINLKTRRRPRAGPSAGRPKPTSCAVTSRRQ